ncbi:hypothetical protein HMPREF1317_1783, partial [Schaalia georgiae F0490]
MDTPQKPTVAMVGLTERERESAAAVASLAGVGVVPEGAAPDLVIAGEGAPRAPGSPVPRVSVGPRGQLRLPKDEAVLMRVLVSLALRRASRGLRLLVAGWHGGVGTTALCRALAFSASCPLIDASGHAPGVLRPSDGRAPGVRWADLDAAETTFLPALASQLPSIRSSPVLAGDRRGCADAADPRLGPVLSALEGAGAARAVVDCGRWDARALRAAQGVGDALVLVGWGDAASALALALDLRRTPVPIPALTLHRR